MGAARARGKLDEPAADEILERILSLDR